MYSSEKWFPATVYVKLFNVTFGETLYHSRQYHTIR